MRPSSGATLYSATECSRCSASSTNLGKHLFVCAVKAASPRCLSARWNRRLRPREIFWYSVRPAFSRRLLIQYMNTRR
ncbi:unnamed protein product [Ixodes pacificus]